MKSPPFLSLLLLLTAAFPASLGFSTEDKERPKILGYQPLSPLVLSNLDLDHFEMGRHLKDGTEESFVKAKRIYEEGAHTKPFAILTLLAPLEIELKNGDLVAGETPNQDTVTGTVIGDHKIGSLQLAVIYNASTRDCSVGASWNPQTQGCFKSSGSVFLKDRDGIAFPYNYNPEEDNQNRMSLQKLSTHAKQQMYVCNDGDCPFRLYARYVDYYGNFTYADHWIQAAFNGGRTDLADSNGNFEHYGFEARADIVSKAAILLNLWMSIQFQLDHAIVSCQSTCQVKDHCNDESVHSWDLAVGWYAGSLAGPDTIGSDDSRFLHRLAEKRCVSFNTCDGQHGVSHVNKEMFDLFDAGQELLTLSKCSDANEIKDRISRLMLIPLIQDALWHAHINDVKPEALLKEKHAAQKISAGAATVAAAILPQIDSCDPQAAYAVYDNLRTGHDASFETVKNALESTYECLGIKCEDVGGLYITKQDKYVEGAEPCYGSGGQPQQASTGDASATIEQHSHGLDKLDVTLIVICTILGAIILCGTSYWAYVKNRCIMNHLPPLEAYEATEDAKDPPSLKVDDAEAA
ncbi:unnamed protein product [Cylindrotheca closterium]|uniref:Uncharacterized protein n=1 Tax=Cylindrotheca closterium TaxID=2856 RepID=A0AAD2PXY8_9STRA|nr:unnamed protein product [Cylindrotheca closterium]